MAGGKGGSSTTKVEIPEWMEREAKLNLAEGRKVSKIGYTPYYGPDIAAFNDAQVASRQNVNDMASAFGMQGAGEFQMPDVVEVDGVRGYSSAPLYDQALAELETRRPGQYKAIMDRFIDPTGDGSVPDFSNMTAEQLAAFYSRMGGFRV
jgi:hypothetical protein